MHFAYSFGVTIDIAEELMRRYDIDRVIDTLEANPKGIRFSDLSKMLDEWFGRPRKKGSHRIYRTPWQGDPRVNIQNDNGMAKDYQVRQAIKALKRLKG